MILKIEDIKEVSRAKDAYYSTVKCESNNGVKYSIPVVGVDSKEGVSVLFSKLNK